RTMPVRETDAIKMIDYEYEPTRIQVTAGTRITFTNAGQQPHNAAGADAGGWDIGFLHNAQSRPGNCRRTAGGSRGQWRQSRWPDEYARACLAAGCARSASTLSVWRIASVDRAVPAVPIIPTDFASVIIARVKTLRSVRVERGGVRGLMIIRSIVGIVALFCTLAAAVSDSSAPQQGFCMCHRRAGRDRGPDLESHRCEDRCSQQANRDGWLGNQECFAAR